MRCRYRIPTTGAMVSTFSFPVEPAGLEPALAERPLGVSNCEAIGFGNPVPSRTDPLESRRRRSPHEGRKSDVKGHPDLPGHPTWKHREMLGVLAQDVRIAVRGLRRRPGFAVPTILTFAVGIGGITAVFSILLGVLLRPLPYIEADRTVRVSEHVDRGGRVIPFALSAPEFLALRDASDALESVAAFAIASGTLYGGTHPQRVIVARTSWNFFQFLGVTPSVGRFFVEGEDGPAAEPVVVLEYGQWRDQFGGEPDVIGSAVRVDEVTYTVVGVLPADFRWLGFSDPVGLWTPYRLDAAEEGPHFLTVLGRLAPGVGIDRVAADVGSVLKRIHRAGGHSRTWTDAEPAVIVAPLREALLGSVRAELFLLFGAAAFVLLLACTNIANLVLGHGATKRRELAIRRSVGASRGRLFVHLLTEALVLAFAGGLLGLLLARWGMRLLITFAPSGIPRLDEVQYDGMVFGFALSVAVVCGLLSGLLPALRSSRPHVTADLRNGIASQGGERGRYGGRALLVVGQGAMALILVIGAGLMVNSFLRLQSIELGFNPAALSKAEVLLPSTYVEDVGQDAQGTGFVRLLPEWGSFQDDVLQRLAALPGVRGASAAAYVPLSGIYGDLAVRPEGGEEIEEAWTTAHNRVTPGFFETMEIPLLRGRTFDAADGEEASPVAIISEAMAQRFWPDDDPIGQRLIAYHLSPDGAPEAVTSEIVGVVGDVRGWVLRGDASTAVYTPLAQTHRLRPTWDSNLRMAFFVRTAESSPAAAGVLRAAVQGVDPDVPLYSVEPMDQLAASWLRAPRFYTFLLSVFGAFAVLLAALGVFGVVSSLVTQRTREIGIRMALGADRRDVLLLVGREVMILIGLAIGVGVIGAVALTRFLASQLYGVEPTDPVTFASMCALVFTVALIASYLPARRAIRTDPALTLRRE